MLVQFPWKTKLQEITSNASTRRSVIKNMAPKVIRLSSEEVDLLRRRFDSLPEITAFESDLKLASKLASYGMFREIGTVNDELARFIFDANTEVPVPLETLRAEFVEWKELVGLRIYSTRSKELDLRTPGFFEVVHPELSRNQNGSLHSLFIFPEIINKIAKSEGVELVLVKSWGKNTIFGGFDPTKGFYQTNFWEIENNDALKFADLVRNGKIAFMGTHDLIAHIAGIRKQHWPLLKLNAERVFQSINAYFNSNASPSISALILPYTLGVILDDLAQPPSYSSLSHQAVLDELLLKMETNEIPANLPTLLTRFPRQFQEIINLSRTPKIETQINRIRNTINTLVKEILEASLVDPI